LVLVALLLLLLMTYSYCCKFCYCCCCRCCYCCYWCCYYWCCCCFFMLPILSCMLLLAVLLSLLSLALLLLLLASSMLHKAALPSMSLSLSSCCCYCHCYCYHFVVIVIVIDIVLAAHAMQRCNFWSTRTCRHPEMLFDTSVVSNTNLSVAKKAFGHWLQQFRPTTTTKRYMRDALPAVRVTCVTGCLWVGRGTGAGRGGPPRNKNQWSNVDGNQTTISRSEHWKPSWEAGWVETLKHHLDFARGRFVIDDTPHSQSG